jgi:N-methylhydantoinase A/oxoprolinase/acetone carboxylase beta subunit
MTTDNTLRIGIDIGGTFTDFVIFDSGSGSPVVQAAIHA